jgi:cell division protein FtsB
MSAETVWGRLNRLLVFLLFVSATVLVGVWYLPLIRVNESLQREQFRLEQEVRLEQDKMRQKRAAIEALHNNPKTIERLAREKLGLARPGETVAHFVGPAAPGAQLQR